MMAALRRAARQKAQAAQLLPPGAQALTWPLHAPPCLHAPALPVVPAQPDSRREQEGKGRAPQVPLQPKQLAEAILAAKSRRRSRAEAALSSVFSGLDSSRAAGAAMEADAAAMDADPAAKRARTGQQGPSAARLGRCERAACQACEAGEASWCQMPVSLPSLDFPALSAALAAQSGSQCSREGGIRAGGVEVILVERAEGLPAALGRLRSSMADGVVAIDLEWRPDYTKGASSKVALMQLGSSTCAVLVHTSRMGFRLPPVLRDFLQDPNVHLCGFAWDAADERKLRATFGLGRESFGSFLDLQSVAKRLGYRPTLGLQALGSIVLGWSCAKPKKVTRSNWELPQLKPAQVAYAALDVLVPGHVFRVLRSWHAEGRPCPACQLPLGFPLGAYGIRCQTCQKGFKALEGLQSHCAKSGHALHLRECHTCQRWGPRGAASSQGEASRGAEPGERGEGPQQGLGPLQAAGQRPHFSFRSVGEEAQAVQERVQVMRQAARPAHAAPG